jgi:methylglyoxal synthase
MRIALMAQDKKKEQMVRFCLTNAGILSQHKLYATGTTGKMVQEFTGLPVHRYLTGRQGGEQQIAARIAYDELDMLIFFRDTLTVLTHSPYDDILRLCDTHNVPYATNQASAEALLFALANQDLSK